MALREIIEIDEDTCDGCGACATGCPEGALQIIEGKARLVGESLCDGLGACLGECPRGAISVTRREAEAYDEAKVMEGMSRLGPPVIAAHLEHLAHHGQDLLESQALAWLTARGLEDPRKTVPSAVPGGAAPDCRGGGCPGSASRRFNARAASVEAVRTLAGPGLSRAEARGLSRAEAPAAQPNPGAADQSSALGHWPIQLHLANPGAPQYRGAKLLIAADCTAFALGSFHPSLLSGRSLVIACPKLDDRTGYVEKLARLIALASRLEVAIMEVPCCSGLLKLVTEARALAGLDTPIAVTVVGVEGGIVRSSQA